MNTVVVYTSKSNFEFMPPDEFRLLFKYNDFWNKSGSYLRRVMNFFKRLNVHKFLLQNCLCKSVYKIGHVLIYFELLTTVVTTTVSLICLTNLRTFWNKKI